jgi:hypothetical protein
VEVKTKYTLMKMRLGSRNIFLILLVLLGLMDVQHARSQETRKHRWMWFRFGLKKHPDAFNPNIKHGKSTHEQSRKQKKEDARVIREAKKEYKKSIRRSARIRKRGK